jgi:FkbM family methyltransferase
MSELIDRILEYQSKLGIHRAGSLVGETLERLEWYVRNSSDGSAPRTIETGCGASTIVFAQYAAQHTAYCYDDRQFDASSVSYAQNFPGFRNECVQWIFGPTQRTVLSQPTPDSVDLILLDGPHGYPFPELEYFALVNSLRPGGILVVDDIHIPTIEHLYEFLVQDDAFVRQEVSATTAYFRRTESPSFDMESDGWWLQRYNVQAYPAVSANPPRTGVQLPVRLVFDGARLKQSQVLARGFSFLDSPPLTDGGASSIELRLAERAPARVSIRLEIEPVCVAEREAGVDVLVDSREAGSWSLNAPGRRTLELEAPTEARNAITVELRHRGIKRASELQGWTSPYFDGRLLNFRLHSVSVSDAAMAAAPNTIRRADGSIVSFDYCGQPFAFFVDEPDDAVQAFHAHGGFYELDVLEEVRALGPTIGSILDVGAHVGNHSIYFEKVVGARRVVAIEPDPRAQALLRTNCALNGVSGVDLSHLGKALGNAQGSSSLVRPDRFDSGATQVRIDGGSVPVCRGDDLFATEQFDLIKIDVEGTEIDVLEGLTETIGRCRPVLVVEVEKHNWDKFLELMTRWRFDVTWSSPERSGGQTHVVVRPSTARTWTAPVAMTSSDSSSKPSMSLPLPVVRAARRLLPVPMRNAITRRVAIHTE